MAISRKNNNELDFFKKYGLMILGCIFIIPVAWNWYKKQGQNSDNIEAKNEIKDFENEQKIEQAKLILTSNKEKLCLTITPKKHLWTIAQNIAEYLHVNYAWYDTRYYWEEDKRAYNEFTKFNRADMPTVKRLYNEVFTKNRDLQKDCNNLLDEELYNLIKWQ